MSGPIITVSGPQGCGKTLWAEHLRRYASMWDGLPTPIIAETSEPDASPPSDIDGLARRNPHLGIRPDHYVEFERKPSEKAMITCGFCRAKFHTIEAYWLHAENFHGAPAPNLKPLSRNPDPSAKPDLTLRELQTCLPWTVHYSSDFRASPMVHKDFAHGLTHVIKAAGALASLVDDMDHRKETADDPEIRGHTKYLADLVICALRMANTFPGGVVDLQRAVEDRLEGKNGVTLPRRPV